MNVPLTECNLVVGQQVVLEHDFDPVVRASAPRDGIILPEKGVVYTIREIGFIDDILVVWLKEIVNKPIFYVDVWKTAEQGFDPARFRPVRVVRLTRRRSAEVPA